MNEEDFKVWLQKELYDFNQDFKARVNDLGGKILANMPTGDGGDTGTDFDPKILFFQSENGSTEKPYKTKLWKLLINNNDRYTVGEEFASRFHPRHGTDVYDLGMPSKADYGKPPVIADRQTKWSEWKYVRVVVDGERKRGLILKWHHGYWEDGRENRW